ncbi:DNA-binding helix-turn-helix protein [Schaalia georgiae F0490]|uniref:DNA-binding helix-turn-helix protein n=1 Tax=Schaalia georgiae F0490 TaxID=1125717 RepID=J0P2S0_9ACTO|nr:helix-turn-helix domain-containing protein [Schaalia georgiae]EJF51687.1 DNA-binding helix-turn-helix protein [Schaalia georgiae F0490]
MSFSQSIISRETKRFMRAHHITQADLGQYLKITQSQVSARLRGTVRWTLDDLDRLCDLGVPVRIASGQEAWS